VRYLGTDLLLVEKKGFVPCTVKWQDNNNCVGVAGEFLLQKLILADEQLEI